MIALDLFCGEGGVSMGLYQAGFEVVGIDISPKPKYPFSFIQGDALKPPVDTNNFDFIWASPPCQSHSSLKYMHNAKEHADLIPATREFLISTGKPWVMENVPGAPLKSGLMLCGSMFDLGTETAELRRHRFFELSFHVPIFGLPTCTHGKKDRVIGVYGGHGRDRRRKVNTQDFSLSDRRKAMGIDWMTGYGLCQAIPPAYSKYIASLFFNQLSA